MQNEDDLMMNPLARNQLNVSQQDEDQKNTCCTTIKKSFADLVLVMDEDKIKYLKNYNCIPPPFFMLLLSLSELLVFIYYGIKIERKSWLTMDDALLKSPLIFDPYKREEIWRFLTYMFLHADLEHIISNILLQLSVGIMLEMVHKSFRVFLVFMSGVLAGSLASSVFDPYIYLVGASGGVYALLGGFLMNVILNWEKMAFNGLHLLYISSIIIADVGFSIWRRVIKEVVAVSLVAHVAGGFAGISIGCVVFRKYEGNLITDPSWWVSVGAFLFFLCFVILWNLFLSPAGSVI